MFFSISASSDRKTYTVVNKATRQTATLVYDFDNGTATVSGDFCLVPIGVCGFPYPTDLPLAEFGEISVTFDVPTTSTYPRSLVSTYGTSVPGSGSTPGGGSGGITYAYRVINGIYDDSTKTGIFSCGSFDFTTRSLLYRVKNGEIPLSTGAKLQVFLTGTPTNQTDTTAGRELAYTFAADGLSAQCEFPGVHPCLVHSMGVKLSSDIGTAPASVDVPCDENRAYAFRKGLFPALAQFGHQFDGWFTDSACQTQAVDGETYTASTLFAKWTTLDTLCVTEHIKKADGSYSAVHRETEAFLVKITDGRNLEQALQEMARDIAQGAIDAAPARDLVAHIGDETAHITDAERSAWNAKQNALSFDSAPTAGSSKPVTSGGVKAALQNLENMTVFAANQPTNQAVGGIWLQPID